MKLFKVLAAGTIALGLASCQQTIPEDTLAVRMVKSEITRMPSADMIDYNTQLKWNYTHGLELQSMMLTAAQYPHVDKLVWDYATQYLDTIINADGSINKYKKTNYTLDHINPGKMLFLAYDRTKDQRYRTAMDTLYSQLQTHPRVSEGGFWHKNAYPHQMWLDGIYMEAPYYAEYAKRFLSGDEQKRAFDDVVNQFMVVARHTYDPANGLYRHAWDESREMGWSDPETGQAPHVWGRALGWYTMAMVDVLDLLPEGYSGRDSIQGILQPLCDNLLKIQNPETLAWEQVLDQTGREGNYQETSCTAMFAYTFLKGALKGFLPKEYWARGYNTLQSLTEHFVVEDQDEAGNPKGTISLTRVCGVAGLGGSPYRDGSFEYYVNEIIRDNDPKGVGPYIMANLLAEKYGPEIK